MTKPIPPCKTCTSWLAMFVVPASPVLATSKRRSTLVESKIRKILVHTFIKRTRHSTSSCTRSNDVSHKVSPCQVASELWYLIISTKIITMLVHVQETRWPHLLGIWKQTSTSGSKVFGKLLILSSDKRAWFTYQTARPGLLTQQEQAAWRAWKQ